MTVSRMRIAIAVTLIAADPTVAQTKPEPTPETNAASTAANTQSAKPSPPSSMNARSLDTIVAGTETPNAEYAAEIDCGIHATDWLILRPNVQYVIDPGGYSSATDVVVAGMQGAVTF